MAIFGRKKAAVQRLKDREWANPDEQKLLIGEVLAGEKFPARTMMWPLYSRDPAIRQFGLDYAERYNAAEIADAVLHELEGQPEHMQRALFHFVSRRPPDDIRAIASKLLEAKEKTHKEMGVRLVKFVPIDRIGGLVHALVKDPSPHVRLLGLEKLLESGNALADPVIRAVVLELTRDYDESVRVTAFRVVAMAPVSRDEQLRRVLIDGMRDSSATNQQLAAEALGRHLQAGDQATLAAMIELLSDGRPSVRQAVISGLLRWPDRKQVVRQYLEFTKALAGWVRERALESLLTFRNELLEPVIQLMADPDEEIRLLALTVGGNFEDPRCVAQIIQLLNDSDWWTRITAADTLGRIGDPRAVGPLIELLGDEELRWTAIDALAEIGHASAVGPISRFLEHPTIEIRLAAIEALSKFNTPEVLKFLEARARRDETRTVRERALEAVKRLKKGVDVSELEAAVSGPLPTEGLNACERLMVEVRNRGGSDLHLSVGLPPLARIEGELLQLDMPPLRAPEIQRLLEGVLNDRLKELLRDDLQVDFCHSIPNIGRFRSNVFVQRLGIGAVFRVIPGKIPTLDSIGMPPHMAELANHHQGLIVVAGASGSGKTTTLAALVNLMNETKCAHIITIEDPIEFAHPLKNCLVNQREVGKHTQTFSKALRGALREDPDIVVVGELRDPETTKMALAASETGHLVIVTMNTTTAPKTIDRLIEVFPPNEQPQVRLQLSESFKAIICQTLLPRKDGSGRVACFEILLSTMSTRSLVRDSKTHQIASTMQVSKNLGMRTKDMALLELVERDLITPEIGYMRADSREHFEGMVSPEFVLEATGAARKEEATAQTPV